MASNETPAKGTKMETPAEVVAVLWTGFEETYLEFLIEEEFEDTPLVRLSFITSAIEVTREHPCDWPEVQELFVQKLEDEHQELLLKIAKPFVKDFLTK